MRSLKFLLVLMAVVTCTGLKAADTLSVRDLTYTTINIDTADITFNDSITASDAVLADYRANAYAKGYKLVVAEPAVISMEAISGTDTYSFLFDNEFNQIGYNDDYNGYNTGFLMLLEAGEYYWVVTPYSKGNSYITMTISIAHSNAVYAKDFAYTPISFNTTIEDSLTENASVLLDVRSGSKAQGYTFTVSGDDNDGADIILDTKGSWDSYLFLLDDRFSVIARNDDADNGSRITKVLNEGKYYIIVTQYDNDEFGPYSLTLNAMKLYDYNELTYVPIVPDTTIYDSISTNSALVRVFGGAEIMMSKGYSVSLSQGDILQMSLDAASGVILMMLDTNYHEVALTSLSSRFNYDYYVEQSGTYYVLLLESESVNYGISFILRQQPENQVYYVDAVNGSDENSGIAADEAFASLDYVMNKMGESDSAVVCYLMSDVKLNEGRYSYDDVLLHLYPYEGRNITISSDTIVRMEFNYSYIEIGHKDSGSITFTLINDTNSRLIETYSGNLIFNNVNVNNIKGIDVVKSDNASVELNNCSIENNTMKNSVIYGNGLVKCNNCRIAYNEGEVGIFACMEGVYALNNTAIIGNKSPYPAVLAEVADLYINNVVMDSNESYMAEMIVVPDTMLTTENLGGIMTVMADLYVDGSLTMNDNYLILINDAVVTIGDNATLENAGVIMPMYIPNIMGSVRTIKSRDDVGLCYAYYEGKRVLAGNVYPNYKSFDLYQPGKDTTWYIISDGTLSMQDDVAVEEAANDDVNIYPNPTSGMLYIHTGNAQVTGVRLIDIQGRIICNQAVENESIQLNMQSLAHGMYFVQLMNREGVLATRKVVKK